MVSRWWLSEIFLRDRRNVYCFRLELPFALSKTFRAKTGSGKESFFREVKMPRPAPASDSFRFRHLNHWQETGCDMPEFREAARARLVNKIQFEHILPPPKPIEFKRGQRLAAQLPQGFGCSVLFNILWTRYNINRNHP